MVISSCQVLWGKYNIVIDIQMDQSKKKKLPTLIVKIKLLGAGFLLLFLPSLFIYYLRLCAFEPLLLLGARIKWRWLHKEVGSCCPTSGLLFLCPLCFIEFSELSSQINQQNIFCCLDKRMDHGVEHTRTEKVERCCCLHFA